MKKAKRFFLKILEAKKMHKYHKKGVNILQLSWSKYGTGILKFSVNNFLALKSFYLDHKALVWLSFVWPTNYFLNDLKKYINKSILRNYLIICRICLFSSENNKLKRLLNHIYIHKSDKILYKIVQVWFLIHENPHLFSNLLWLLL